jgi:outer membrane immunogenic protein
MIRFAAILAGVSLLAVTSAASAADLMTSPDFGSYAPAVHDWSGFYAGVNGGYGAGTVDWTGDYNLGGSVVGSEDGSFDISGWTAGGQVGANMQMGNFVLGVEGDINWANISGEGDPIDGNDPDSTVPSGTLDWLGSLRGRAGIAMDTVLLYGTAGLAWGGGSMTLTNLDSLDDDRTEDVSASGWLAGVGAEMAVSDNMSVRAEYTYTALTMDPVDFGSVPPADSLTANSDIGVSAITMGVNFKF